MSRVLAPSRFWVEGRARGYGDGSLKMRENSPTTARSPAESAAGPLALGAKGGATKERLLEAAERLFAQHGFQGGNMLLTEPPVEPDL